MRILSNGKKYLVLIIIGFVIVAALYFIARPIANLCIQNYEDAKDKKAEIAAIDTNIQNFKALESKMSDIKNTISKAETFIPSELSLGPFIIEMESAAKKSNIDLESIDLEAPTKNQSSTSNSESQAEQASGEKQNTSAASTNSSTQLVQTSSANQKAIEITASGKYTDLRSFLANMRKLSRFNIIKKLSIDTQQQKDQITASFAVVIFTSK